MHWTTDHSSLEVKTVHTPSWVFTPEVRQKIAQQMLAHYETIPLVKDVLDRKTTFTLALRPLGERANDLLHEFEDAGTKFRRFRKEEIYESPYVKQTLNKLYGIIDCGGEYRSGLVLAQKYVDLLYRCYAGVSEQESRDSNAIGKLLFTMFVRNPGISAAVGSLIFSQLCATGGSDNHALTLMDKLIAGGFIGYFTGGLANAGLGFMIPRSPYASFVSPTESLKKKAEILDEHFQTYYLAEKP